MSLRSHYLINSVLFAATIICPAMGQAGAAVKQKPGQSLCSNVVALAGNVNINCSTLSKSEKATIDSIPAILHKILVNELPTDEVLKKLDELQKEIADRNSLSTSISVQCDQNSGNCAGVNNGQQITNRYGEQEPPPVILNVEQTRLGAGAKLILDEPGDLVKNPGVIITFTVDRIFSIPEFDIFCDHPCKASDGAIQNGMMFQARTFDSTNPLHTRIAFNTAGVVHPGDKILVIVRSLAGDDFAVTRVEPFMEALHK
jgi:hypothetical protein